MLESIYNGTKSRVKIGNKISEDFVTNTGVKQGVIMSPLLFNMYINDLPEYIGTKNSAPELDGQKVNALLYADDLVLLSLSA